MIPKKASFVACIHVEVIIFLNIFSQNMIPSIQFYLFAHVHLNLTGHFFLSCKINAGK